MNIPAGEKKDTTNKIAQTTLEFTLCLVILVILFIAAFLAFKWAGETMTNRQKAFEDTRSNPTASFYATPNINLHIE